MKRHIPSGLTLLLMTTTLSLTSPASAQKQCNDPKTNYDRNYCINKVFVQADQDLNTVYKKLMVKLGPKGKIILKRTQRAWIDERNSECQDGGITDLDCETKKTVDRTNFLNDRLRECLSSGCLIGRLQ